MQNGKRFRVIAADLLSDNWGILKRYTIEYLRGDGSWQTQLREVYDRGHAVAALLHDPDADTVLLVRQFRLPTALAGDEEMQIEVPAGLLEGAEPLERMRAELEEETGFRAIQLEHQFDLYASPGAVIEKIYYFLGTYKSDAPIASGGGVEAEGEDIEVMHVPFDDAVAMVHDGRITNNLAAVLLLHLARKLGR